MTALFALPPHSIIIASYFLFINFPSYRALD